MKTHPLLCLGILLLCSHPFISLSKEGNRGGNPAIFSPEGVPASTLGNINRMAAWYRDDGWQERHPATANAGVTYPRGTATAIYACGLVWGGKFHDGINPTQRVSGQVYNIGTKPGAILGIRTGNTEDPSSPDVRIWRIREDYATADLTQDAREYYSTQNPTPAQIDSLRAQYALDWIEWPWQKGAPFYDLNGNGVRDPGEDPGLAAADQVVWFVCNDIDALPIYGSSSSGIELQVTIWGYDRMDGVGNAIFKRYRLIYEGTAASSASSYIDSMYLSQWSDPDIGDSGNDFAGCDTTRNLGYCYNATPTDPDYDTYGLRPPAAGYDVLQGPIMVTGNPADTAIYDFRKIQGARNLPMTSFLYFAAGGTYSDPPFTSDGGIQWYQMLRGFPPTPQGPPDPPRIINPVTGQPTSFWLRGDPVAPTGWLDGSIDQPGDRRIVINSGPFTMALGDTQEIITALVAGISTTNIASITAMRTNDDQVQQLYNTLSGIVTDVPEIGTVPTEFVLEQNYPNPFNPSTVIRYQLPVNAVVSLRVYDVLGQEVATLVHEPKQAGKYEHAFTAANLPSGVYFYRLEANGLVQVKKMALIK